MTGPDGDTRQALATLTCIAEPGSPLLNGLLRTLPPEAVLEMISSGRTRAAITDSLPFPGGELQAAVRRWHKRLAGTSLADDLARHAALGIRLVCPGDREWPARLDDLSSARPYALWTRGTADLRACTARPVAVIGARAATSYGIHISTEIAAGLARSGWTIISGAAYGIDAAAHRAALSTGGTTVAVLACGPDIACPREHRDLLDAIAASGAVISERPPGTLPSRSGFLLRNRVIAALAAGTLVIEAAVRSGTLSAARHAAELGRPLLAVPGPVTSAASAGCHALIRERAASCVTSSADVTAALAAASGASS